ncbi:peptidoglycan DD-metalloendopeptidase family protein [Saccharicrinis sp. FJH2]|uniref:peptidoglycan DD-metalloendopeptidase family protein n=1 Tax=Saccharicrinis sp. FJH65 TaxID=3344659 RepID=UPI0035F3C78D
MIDYLYYLIKVSGIFGILYVFYFAFFSKLTFHRLNRAYLLSILPLSLILPTLKIEFGPNIPISKGLPFLFNDFGTVHGHGIQADSVNQFELSVGNLFFIIYSFVLVLFLIRLILNVFRLIRIKRQSTTTLKTGKFSIIRTGISSSFSFFKWIFLPQHIEVETANQIIEHEKLHGSSYHTLDLILVEIFAAFFWFNPIVYFFRKDLKSVHEFQIDQLLLKGRMKTSDYLQLLLNNLELSGTTAAFCNSFNGSTIERRVKMMTKTKSSEWKAVRYALLVPLLAFITMAFCDQSGLAANIPDISPVKPGNYSKMSGYGYRIHPITKEKAFHFGIDFAAKTGTPVVATANGVVTRVVFLKKTYGKLVEIDHRNSYVTRYAQLSDFAVKEGDQVKKGDVIGYVGQSGLSTGPHLHYEVFKDGKNVNPRDYLTK